MHAAQAEPTFQRRPSSPPRQPWATRTCPYASPRVPSVQGGDHSHGPEPSVAQTCQRPRDAPPCWSKCRLRALPLTCGLRSPRAGPAVCIPDPHPPTRPYEPRPWRALGSGARSGPGVGCGTAWLSEGRAVSTEAPRCPKASQYQPHKERITPTLPVDLDTITKKAKCDGHWGGHTPESVTANFHQCPASATTSEGSGWHLRGGSLVLLMTLVTIREQRRGPCNTSSRPRRCDLGRITYPCRDPTPKCTGRDGSPASLTLLNLSPTLPATSLDFLFHVLGFPSCEWLGVGITLAG